MAGATTTSVVNLLQKNYLPGITRQFNDDFPNLRFIRQNTSSISAEGDEAVIAIQTGLNEGGSFHGENADVAASGYSRVSTVAVRLKQMTFRLRISLKLMRKARTNAAAFARALQHHMTATRDAVTLTANQYLWGDGTGVQARVVSETVTADNKMILDRAYGLTAGGSPESIIREGQTLHILDTSTFQTGVSNDRGTGIVKNVDWDTGTDGQVEVELEAGHTMATATLAADDYVFLQNTMEGWTDAGESEDNSPAMGMLGFYNATLRPTLQGLAASDVAKWAPEQMSATQTSVIADLRRARNRVAKRVKRGRVAYAISSYETHERYANALDSKVEFRNVNRFDSGWDFTNFFGRPWFMDHTAPDGILFMVPSGGIIQRYAVTRFVEFVEEGGSSLNLVPNKTVFDVLLTAIYEYGISRRNALISVDGMTWNIYQLSS